jgi:hypothetical protein
MRWSSRQSQLGWLVPAVSPSFVALAKQLEAHKKPGERSSPDFDDLRAEFDLTV